MVRLQGQLRQLLLTNLPKEIQINEFGSLLAAKTRWRESNLVAAYSAGKSRRSISRSAESTVSDLAPLVSATYRSFNVKPLAPPEWTTTAWSNSIPLTRSVVPAEQRASRRPIWLVKFRRRLSALRSSMAGLSPTSRSESSTAQSSSRLYTCTPGSLVAESKADANAMPEPTTQAYLSSSAV